MNVEREEFDIRGGGLRFANWLLGYNPMGCDGPELRR